MTIALKGPMRCGPFGSIGSPTGRSAFSSSNWSTQTIVAQVGLEVWVINDPPLIVDQVGLEVWVQNNPGLIVTQVGLEVWSATVRGEITLTPRAKLGPVGFLGIPPRTFRERSIPIPIFVPPAGGNVPAFFWTIT